MILTLWKGNYWIGDIKKRMPLDLLVAEKRKLEERNRKVKNEEGEGYELGR